MMNMRTCAALAAGSLLSLTVIACERTPDVTDETEVGTAESQEPVAGTAGESMASVADIQEHPEQFTGRTVTLEAEVDRVLGPRAFFVDDEAALEGGIDNDLLVLTRDPSQAATAEQANDQWVDQRVRVTGTVDQMTIAEVEEEVGWDLDEEIEAEFEEAETIIIADSVQRVDR